MSDEYIEVDWFLCGVYQGKRKVGKNSICGSLLSGNFEAALKGTSAMVDELNQIPGVKASSGPTLRTPDAAPLAAKLADSGIEILSVKPVYSRRRR